MMANQWIWGTDLNFLEPAFCVPVHPLGCSSPCVWPQFLRFISSEVLRVLICPSAMQIALNSVPTAKPVEPTTPTGDKVGKFGKEKLRKTARAVSEQRKAEQFLKEMDLIDFLHVNHFFEDDVNAQRLGHHGRKEQVRPIHLAAELGDADLLRRLLRAKADATQD
eukprot:s210_g1.t1